MVCEVVLLLRLTVGGGYYYENPVEGVGLVPIGWQVSLSAFGYLTNDGALT